MTSEEYIEQLTEAVKQAIDDVDMEYQEYNWNGAIIYIRQLLPIEEAIDIVAKILEGCYNEKSGGYALEMLDFSLRVNILMAYTGIALPDNVRDQYKLAYGTGLYDDVLDVINVGQLDAIKESLKLVTNKIEFNTG